MNQINANLPKAHSSMRFLKNSKDEIHAPRSISVKAQNLALFEKDHYKIASRDTSTSRHHANRIRRFEQAIFRH